MAMNETAQVPVSLLGGAGVGQTVELTVDSIDEASGMATLSAGGEAPEPAETEPPSSAIDGASKMFNE